jgi:hypothetical protein
MKLVKSLLLGTAAGLVTVAGAQAADLPVRKAAAVEYVQLCPAFGRGFWTIPGTDSCLAISGRVRAEFLVREQETAAQDATGFRARGRLNFDVRTATALGPVRAYIRYEATTNSGAIVQGGLTQFGGLAGAGNLGGAGSTTGTSTTFALEQAYVQWGGFIAGKNTSTFSFAGPGGDRYFGARFDDGPNTEQFSYLFEPGEGLQIQVGIENPLNRRTNATAFAGVPGVAPVLVPPGTFAFGPNSGILNYGGQELPDIVGAVAYRGTWGRAFVSGAVHQVNDVGVTTTALVPGGFAPAVVVRGSADDEIGFAVSGFVEANLPFITPGSLAWVWAGYSDGAPGYMGYGNLGLNPGGGLANNSFLGGPGSTSIGGLPVADAVVINGSIQTTEVFSLAAGMRFNLTPQFRANVYGSYSVVDYAAGSSSVVTAGPFFGARTGFVDFEEGLIAGNVIYTPIAGLDLGVEVLYANVNPQGSVIATRPLAGGGFVQSLRGDEDVVAARFRVERNF